MVGSRRRGGVGEIWGPRVAAEGYGAVDGVVVFVLLFVDSVWAWWQFWSTS